MAYQVRARAIIAFTTGGTTALRVSKYRPSQPIIAVTPSETIARRLSLVWGVLTVIRPAVRDLDKVFNLAREVALETGIARQGDLIITTAGIPLSVPGSTNMVRVQSV